MATRITTIIVFFLLAASLANSQHSDSAGFSKSLWLDVDNLNFIKNNEYFSPYAEGYTLLGFHLTPVLSYRIKDKLILQGGMHALKYSGRDDFRNINPYFSLSYRFNRSLKMTLGSYSAGKQHHLPDALYNSERCIDAYIENGLNVTMNTDRLFANVWLDWDKFVYRHDPFREKFTAGGALDWTIPLESSGWGVGLPFYLLARHKGGQINDSDLPVTTVMNFGIGARLYRNFTSSRIRKLQIQFDFLGYRESSNKNIRPFRNGQAFHPSLSFVGRNLVLRAGYWKSEKFYAPLGNPLYQNIAVNDNDNYRKNHDMVTAALHYDYSLLKNVTLKAAWENYFDINTQGWDYNISLMVAFSEAFFLKSVR